MTSQALGGGEFALRLVSRQRAAPLHTHGHESKAHWLNFGRRRVRWMPCDTASADDTHKMERSVCLDRFLSGDESPGPWTAAPPPPPPSSSSSSAAPSTVKNFKDDNMDAITAA
jgi:hypothetical protein